MKLATLFAKYLYQHKELRLPGIGIFTIDPSLAVPPVNDKDFPGFLAQIRYNQVPVSSPDEEFINFIRTETGKIKPLAEADLDSFLADGKILLNLGKPFFFEGIGALQKHAGKYEFTPGGASIEKLELTHHEPVEEVVSRKPFFEEPNTKGGGLRKLLAVLAVFGGLALVIWGGYSLYNRSGGTGNSELATSSTPSSSLPDGVTDSTKAEVINDSVHRIIDSTLQSASRVPDPADATGRYRFIIERTASKRRALKRYNQLKENLTDIRMETADSTFFTLYFVLPAQPSDTARIRDSLKWWYASRKVEVEPAR